MPPSSSSQSDALSAQRTSTRFYAADRPLLAAVAAVVVAVAALYIGLLATYLRPLNGFWSSDQGVKLIQTQNLLLNRYRDNALHYPGAVIDPEGRFSPLRGQYLERDGRVYAMFSEAFAAVSGVPFFLLGYPGLYVVPLVSTLLLLIVIAALGRYLLDTAWTVGVLLMLAVASPLMFYSLIFWEHTLATLLVTLALLAAARALLRARQSLLLAAAACIGIAAWFRNETVLALPALVLALLIQQSAGGMRTGSRFLVLGSLSQPRTKNQEPAEHEAAADVRRAVRATGRAPDERFPRNRQAPWHDTARYVVLLIIGGAGGIAPLLLFNQLVYGSPLGPHVLVAGRTNDLQVATGLAGFLEARRAWAAMLIAPLDRPLLSGALLSVLAIVGATWIAGRRHTSRPAGWLYAMVGALLGFGLALQATPGGGFQTTLLVTFPPVLLCLVPAHTPREQTSQARLTDLLLWFGLAYIALAWLARLPDGGAQWGPRVLLPAIPALTLAAAVRLAVWVRSGPAPAFAVAAAVALLVNLALFSQVAGLRQLRAFNTGNHQIATTVAQSGAQAVITDIWYAPPLLAQLFYDGRLVFLVDNGRDLDDLLGRLEASGTTEFYYLGARSAELAAESTRWPELAPLEVPRSLPHNLSGVRYRLNRTTPGG
jgi:hypothetical protein